MYCKNCGKSIADDSKFCRYCGWQQDAERQPSIIPNHSKDDSNNSEVLHTPESTIKPAKSGGNRLLALFLWSIAICILCTLGYAMIRSEDAQAYDSTHYWGSSVYDPEFLTGGTLEDTHEEITWIRQDEYQKGIKNTAIYSFPIAFGILVIGAILTGNMNKK